MKTTVTMMTMEILILRLNDVVESTEARVITSVAGICGEAVFEWWDRTWWRT